MRRNPRHADVVLASIEGTYQLPLRPLHVAKFLVVAGKSAGKDVSDLLARAVMTGTTRENVAENAAWLAPGEYTVCEISGHKVVGTHLVRVSA